MRLSLPIGAALFLLSSLIQSSADESLELTLDSLPSQVQARNPHLAAARWRIAEARGRLRQSGRLPNPEFESEFSHSRDFDERGFSLAFTQSFPVTSRLRLEKEVSRTEVLVAEAEVRDIERVWIAQARDAGVRLLAVEAQKALREKQSALAESLSEFVTAAANQGEVSGIDAGQARLDAAQFALETRQLDAEAATILGELRPLLGLPSDADLQLNGELLDARLPDEALLPDPAHRPDYQAAQLAVDAADQEILLERSRRYGDVSAGVFVEGGREEDAPEGFENEAAVGVRLSVPLPFWDKNEGAIEEKHAKRIRLQKEVFALANGIENEAGTAMKQMKVQAELLGELSSALLPLTLQQVEMAEAAYRQGQSDLLSVLRARDQQLRLESARIDALRDFHRARVVYEAAVAAPLIQE